ncbi:MAG TPA: membrane protein insertion efficiency factor YidD [Acidimicrobiia bacterium]|nr:membrane protein insertion efficiency factor YidD [Acidimicrobiia bacterium]
MTPDAPRTSRSARAADTALNLYQRATVHRLPRCRYFPTCSQYAREAIAAHGAAAGSLLALRRLGRCHPLGGHGFDPVPEARPSRRGAPSLRKAGPC